MKYQQLSAVSCIEQYLLSRSIKSQLRSHLWHWIGKEKFSSDKKKLHSFSSLWSHMFNSNFQSRGDFFFLVLFCVNSCPVFQDSDTWLWHYVTLLEHCWSTVANSITWIIAIFGDFLNEKVLVVYTRNGPLNVSQPP